MSYYALAVGIGWAAGPLAGALLYGIRPEVPFIACFALSVLAALLAAQFDSKDPSGSTSRRGPPQRPVIEYRRADIGGRSVWVSDVFVSDPVPTLPKARDQCSRGGNGRNNHRGDNRHNNQSGSDWPRRGPVRQTQNTSDLHGIAGGVFALMSLHSDWRLFLATGVLAGALAGSLYPLGLALIGQVVRKERLGAATSTFSLAFGIGSLMGPSASGLAMTHFENPKWLLYLPALLCGVLLW